MESLQVVDQIPPVSWSVIVNTESHIPLKDPNGNNGLFIGVLKQIEGIGLCGLDQHGNVFVSISWDRYPTFGVQTLYHSSYRVGTVHLGSGDVEKVHGGCQHWMFDQELTAKFRNDSNTVVH